MTRAGEDGQQELDRAEIARRLHRFAHDLNNLIMIIRGSTELALGDLSQKPGEKLRSHLEEIHLAAERATQLTQELQALAGPRQSGASVHSAPSRDANLATSRTVLLVEDAERIRSLLARVLRDGGYRVLEAAHGREALSVCRQSNVPIDLVLTDVIMPEMSGPDLIRTLRAEGRQTRALFLSGYTPDHLEEQGLEKDTYDFLQKPFLGEALLSKVREMLSRGPNA